MTLPKDIVTIVSDYAYHYKLCECCDKPAAWGHSPSEPFPGNFMIGLFDKQFICTKCVAIPEEYLCKIRKECCTKLAKCIICIRFMNEHMRAPGRSWITAVCHDCHEALQEVLNIRKRRRCS